MTLKRLHISKGLFDSAVSGWISDICLLLQLRLWPIRLCLTLLSCFIPTEIPFGSILLIYAEVNENKEWLNTFAYHSISHNSVLGYTSIARSRIWSTLTNDVPDSDQYYTTINIYFSGFMPDLFWQQYLKLVFTALCAPPEIWFHMLGKLENKEI